MENYLNGLICAEEIYRNLKQVVIGQDEYLKKLAILGYLHQVNIQLHDEGKETMKNNLLVIGPTGCGKTFAVKTMAKFLDVPFYQVDCSNVTQTGYKGDMNVEGIIPSMIDEIGISKAKRAIVFLDEFDKIYDEYLDTKGEGKGAMQNFLKILENNKLSVKDRNVRGDAQRSFDNTCVSFIAAGSFENIKNKKRRKMNLVQNLVSDSCAKMGFIIADDKTEEEKKINEYNIKLDAMDIVRGGFIPELIGRFATVLNINSLNEEDFYNIIKKSGESNINKYEDFYRLHDVELEIKDEVYRNIAMEAYKMGTGARGINNIINQVLEDSMFEICSKSKISKVIIDYQDGKEITTYEKREEKQIEFDDLFDMAEPVIKRNTSEKVREKVLSEFYEDLEKIYGNNNSMNMRLVYELVLNSYRKREINTRIEEDVYFGLIDSYEELLKLLKEQINIKKKNKKKKFKKEEQ